MNHSIHGDGAVLESSTFEFLPELSVPLMLCAILESNGKLMYTITITIGEVGSSQPTSVNIETTVESFW
jgi:hypothetical protein